LKTVTKTIFSFIFGYLFSLPLFSQVYQFKKYNTDNGISQPYIYTINQSKNGYLLIGTGEGLCKFDGISFRSYYTTDGIAENFVTASYRDNYRNLWFGFNQGSVTFYDGKNFKSINTSGFTKSPVTAITSDDKGNIWCATQNDGVFRITKSFEVFVYKLEFDNEHIYSFEFLKNNQLLVGTSEGLKLYELEGEEKKPKFISSIIVVPETKIQCIVKKRNSTSFWIGTEGAGIFLLTPLSKNQFKAASVGKDLGISLPNIQTVYEDNQSNLWVGTFGNGLFKLFISGSQNKFNEYLHLSDHNGLGSKYIKSLYADHEGNLWVGTYGNGVVHMTDNFFTFYKHSIPEVSNNVNSILIDQQLKLFGVENGLLKMDESTKQKWIIYNRSNGFVNDKVTALFQSDSIHFYIGTENNGVYLFNRSNSNFTKVELNSDDLCNSINCITGSANILIIATKNGIFKIDTEKKIKIHFTTENGLPHNNINFIYYDKRKTLWAGAHSNFLSSIDINTNTVQNRKISESSDLLTITGIIEDKHRNLWLSTFGHGVYKIKKEITTFQTEQGMFSNYCYGLIQDGSGNIWIGHRNGLSRIKPQKYVIDFFNKNDGIAGDCNYNGFTSDEDGNVWFGTTDGAIRFDPHKDKKNIVPPIVNITSIKINDKELKLVKDTVLPFDNYKLRIDFIGISFKANSNILYQYKLEGYDNDWSDKTKNNFVQYGRISDGEYTFMVKAYNSDGIGNNTPVIIKITVNPPFWKRIWFIILVGAIIFYSIYLYVKLRERNHRIFQAELQKALNEKTREVIFQKEEIEKKNKDITDSIRYAKRIQDALLPEVKKLHTIFPQSFIFFQPRDIVSGDFYWYDQYGDNAIIACADATGHGVPGAFMSMIGSTLLKDITSRPEVLSPADALATLDEEIRLLLKQTDEEEDHTHDSVDLVICEINTKTNFVRMCSTRRSVFIVKNNELLFLKKENTDRQQYETLDIQLSKGDSIYMFTDGYPDQFGGEKGKKIKTSNMKIMLEQIHSLPFEKQKMIVDRYFNRWKEGYDQVDDVLFIGIHL